MSSRKKPSRSLWYYSVINLSATAQHVVYSLAAQWGPFAGFFAPAYFVWRSLTRVLIIDAFVAGFMAAGMDLIGVAIARIAYLLYVWNRQHWWGRERAARKKRAPFEVALALLAIYVGAVLFLTVGLEVVGLVQEQVGPTWWWLLPVARASVPVAFLLVAVSGYVALAMTGDHEIRAGGIPALPAVIEPISAEPEPVETKPKPVTSDGPAWSQVKPESLDDMRRLIREGQLELPPKGEIRHRDLAEAWDLTERTAGNWHTKGLAYQSEIRTSRNGHEE